MLTNYEALLKLQVGRVSSIQSGLTVNREIFVV